MYLPKRTIPLLFAAACALAAAAYGYAVLSERNDAHLAERIVADCSGKENSSACYEEKVSVLYPSLQLSRIFTVIRDIRTLDTSYQFCHVLAHKLGERVVAEDPAKWIDALAQNPADGLCSNGFIHGVVGGRFRSEVLDGKTLEALVPDFSRACEPRTGWQPSPLDQAICYHGMGHLYDFITDANLPKALSLCERTALHKTGDFRRVCREGVFMQIYQPLEPDDFALIERMPVKPSTSTVRQYCGSFTKPEYEGACLRESWPYFYEDILSGKGLAHFCSGQPNADEELACYQTASAIVGRMSLGKPQQALDACMSAPEDKRGLCIGVAAHTIIEEERNAGERAIGFCESAKEPYANECLRSLAQDARFTFGGDTVRGSAFCKAMPESLRSLCGM